MAYLRIAAASRIPMTDASGTDPDRPIGALTLDTTLLGAENRRPVAPGRVLGYPGTR
jgi:hypothetical protein